jgi:hypothetical protein
MQRQSELRGSGLKAPTVGAKASYGPHQGVSAEDANVPGADVGVCEIEIDGIESDLAFAAARWDLFAFPDVLHVLRIGSLNRALVVYRGPRPEIDCWVGALRSARCLWQSDRFTQMGSMHRLAESLGRVLRGSSGLSVTHAPAKESQLRSSARRANGVARG